MINGSETWQRKVDLWLDKNEMSMVRRMSGFAMNERKEEENVPLSTSQHGGLRMIRLHIEEL